MKVVRALYGLKSYGAASRSLLAETLYDLGYTPSKTDPDVWMRPAIKKNGFKYYDIVLCYVDDVIEISHDPMKTIDVVRRCFTLKNDKAEYPET